MKIESCPKCGGKMHIMQVDTIRFWCFTVKHFQINCQSVANEECPWFDWWMLTRIGAILRWNARCRRERRRMKKEADA